jgi:hypothetical protein
MTPEVLSMNNHSTKWNKDDAGRTTSTKREKRDCTVRAKFTQVKRSGTLNSFIKRFPEGTFYVTIKGHALAVKDGKVHDLMKPKPYCILRKAWRVEALPEANHVQTSV